MGDLTAWQLAVLREAAKGLTMREIAAKHRVSITTTRDHLDKARERLGARNVTNAVAKAYERGLLP